MPACAGMTFFFVPCRFALPSFVVRMEDPLSNPSSTGDVMHKQIIFNLAVADLDKSTAFFTSLGFRANPRFSSENAAFMDIVDDVHVMLMTEPFFASLIDKPLAQAKNANEVIICLSCESREELVGLIARAVAAGGRTPHPLEDHGFMVDQGFEDLDGHLWNLVWMAPPA
jgi:predicted lactoylglutathione lyase